MQGLIALSRAIDRVSTIVGRAAAWMVLAACFVAVFNAVQRKVFGTSSNAWIEAQWLMFGTLVLFAAPWTLLRNEHIRIDILNSRLKPTTRRWIDVLGHLLFLLPVAAIVLWTSWSFAATSFGQREGSSNFGGLPQWPLKMLIPAAFALLIAQGLSELIKHIAVMNGHLDPDALARHAVTTKPSAHPLDATAQGGEVLPRRDQSRAN